MSEPLFYIQNLGYCGNCLLWWKKGGHGYTCDLMEAWKLPQAEAERICDSRPHEDIPWPVDVAERASSLHVSSENLVASKFLSDWRAKRRKAEVEA